jgi:tripartite-type tricarboxylate transporter receptor subunit TctC
MKKLLAICSAVGTLGTAGLGLSQPAMAQEYPVKPIRIVVPYATGGSTDILTRLVAQRVTTRVGQTVLVDNRPGANGGIGTESVVRSPADGYTLLMMTNGQTINAGLNLKMTFDTERDLVPVVNVAVMPNVILVHPSQPMKTIGELIEFAKTNPGKLSYSHAGVGSPQHLTGELFKLVTKTNIVGVPYKGGGPAVADAVAGQVQVVVAGVPPISQHVASGRLRALAVTSLNRSSLLDGVPTVAESGYAGFDANFWIAIVGPKNLPADVINRMNSEVNAVLKDPEITKLFSQQGASPVGGTPAALGDFIKKDIEMWKRVIREANIKVEG